MNYEQFMAKVIINEHLPRFNLSELSHEEKDVMSYLSKLEYSGRITRYQHRKVLDYIKSLHENL